MKKRADGRWQKKKVIDGKTVFFFSTAETEKQAIKDFENQMLAYSKANHKSSHNFKLLAEKALDQQAQTITYNTLQSYTYSMKYLEPFYDKNIEDINYDDVYSLRLEAKQKLDQVRPISIGQASTIWNGYTDITIDTRLTVFNTKNMQEFQVQYKRAQYYNIMSYAWEILSKNKELQ